MSTRGEEGGVRASAQEKAPNTTRALCPGKCHLPLPLNMLLLLALVALAAADLPACQSTYSYAWSHALSYSDQCTSLYTFDACISAIIDCW